VCRNFHEVKGTVPDCDECSHKMPDPELGNLLFLRIMTDSVGRDFNGMIDMNVFLGVLDIYAEIMKMDARDKLLLIRKANFVFGLEAEDMVEKREMNKSKNKFPKTNKGPKTISGI